MPPHDRTKRHAPKLDPAAERRIIDNQKLVFSQARGFIRLNVLSYDELVSEGYLALIQAARKWQGLGTFSTYAVTAIKRQMLKGMKRRLRNFIGQEPDDGPEGAWLDTLPADAPLAREVEPTIDWSILTQLEYRVLDLTMGLTQPQQRWPHAAAELGLTVEQLETIREGAIATLRGAITDDEQ